MKLDLLFDARHVRASGIGVYSRQQITLMGLWARQNDLKVGVLGTPEHIGDVGHDIQIFRSDPDQAKMYTVQEQLKMYETLRIARPKAFWTPHYPYPVLSTRRTFVTVHDVLHALRLSEGGPRMARRLYARSMIRLALRRSQGVFVPSIATKHEVYRLFGEYDNVHVAPMRIDTAWFDKVDHTQLPESLPKNYVLFVGNVKKHKNLIGLLSAFELIKDKVDVDLVLAGGAANVRNQDLEVFRRVERLGQRVHITGNLPFPSLRATVAQAQCLVMPSHYEGVGLPPLEAMAVGTPVLASDIPSLRETCGEAATYFDSTDTESMATCITQILESPAIRDIIATKGKEQLRKREASVDPLLPFKMIAESCF